MHGWVGLKGPGMNGNNVGFVVTSQPTADYNCIAWAADDDSQWWEPHSDPKCYWPENISRDYSLTSYIEAYKTLGYELCSDPRIDPGFKKVAIYVGSDGIPTHAARQLQDGRWTSKLGASYDVEHDFIYQWIDSQIGLYPHRLSDYGELGAILRKTIYLVPIL